MEEQSEPKRKFRINPILALFVSILTIYILVYLVLRVNHDIVHYKTWTENQVFHKLNATMPEGHKLYMETLLSETTPEKADAELQRTIKYHQNKKESFNIAFYPLMQLETYFWLNFDTEIDGDLQ